MTAAVTKIYRLLDVCGIVPPCRLKPQYGNPLASFETDLGVTQAKLAELVRQLGERLSIKLSAGSVQRCTTVGDLARLIP